jgi:hypothetical protein
MRRTIQLSFAIQLVQVCFGGQAIGILFDFGTQPESAVVDLMKTEIRSILEPAQLELSFQSLGERGATQPFRKVVIVRFHGACQAQSTTSGIQLEEPAILDYPALGRTEISGGRVLPYIQVYCNEVRAFVPLVSTIPFAQLYGRALGRVVVHELYHALLSTREHSRTGVARVAQSARDLTREKFSLDPLSIGRLRALYGTKEKEGDSEEPPSN